MRVCCAVIDDCRRVEFEADEVVESSTSSITLHVWRVASGAKETLRFAIDFRRAARASNTACFWICLWSSAVGSVAPPSCSALVVMLVLLLGLLVPAAGLNGSAALSWFANDGLTEIKFVVGAGVEKSMRSSLPALEGDFDFAVLRLRSSSKLGMFLGGVKGTDGFRIDLICCFVCASYGLE